MKWRIRENSHMALCIPKEETGAFKLMKVTAPDSLPMAKVEGDHAVQPRSGSGNHNNRLEGCCK